MTPALSIAVVAGVALGGALGAVTRLLLDRFLPFGILLANTAGCLILGYLYGEFSHRQEQGFHEAGFFSEPVLTVVVFGVLGALSTFATVSLRAAQHWISGRRLQAAGMWVLHVGCGFAAAALGIALSGL